MVFCGPFPTEEYFMVHVVICDYSRYPLVEKLSLTAQNVIYVSHIERFF